MSFLATSALLVGLFVVLPLAAHLLRRGKPSEQEFPPASLVPEAPSTSRQRSRLEDRSLFTLRSLMILALALLGATPLMRCSRLSVARKAGGSVALALVLDDSQSMQATLSNGKTRWELALGGARELLASARSGDAFAIIRGSSASIAQSPTTDLDSVKKTLSELEVTDAGTRLPDAVKTAALVLKSLPQSDKRVVLLSDLAGDPWGPVEVPVWAPLPALGERVEDCAVTSAEQAGETVLAEVACSSAKAAQGRDIEVVVATPEAQKAASNATNENPALDPGSVVASKPLVAQIGTQQLQLPIKQVTATYDVRLSGTDANGADDRAPVSQSAAAFSVAVVADPAKASVITGGATVIEQALAALKSDVHVQPLADVPEESKDLTPLGLLIVDDPAGLSPEARGALEEWVQHGGVGLGLLGPSSRAIRLASSLEPFAKGGRWEELSAALGVDVKSAVRLGDLGGELSDLTHTGRMRLDGAEFPETEVLLRWQDGLPFIQSRALGGGLILTVGLPASVDQSDLAIRPLFLAILSYVVEQAELRRGPERSVAGSVWSFPGTDAVSVEGPSGPVPLTREAPPAGARPSTGVAPSRVLRVEHRGRYRVRVANETQTRVVTLDPEEILRVPGVPPSNSGIEGDTPGESKIDVSSEVALFVLGLMAVEMLVRVLGPLVRARAERAATTEHVHR